jgi:hypothetical protein
MAGAPINHNPQLQPGMVKTMATNIFRAMARVVSHTAFRHFPWLLALANASLFWRKLCSTL